MALRAQSWRSGCGRTHEANHWLQRFIDGYNARDHRREPQSRADDWLANLPSDGARAMYRWEHSCTFARVRERRSVGLDYRLTVVGSGTLRREYRGFLKRSARLC